MLVLAGATVAYCLYMLSVIATIPDLRLRFLLIDPSPALLDWHRPEQTQSRDLGIVVQRMNGIEIVGEMIRPGDRLLQVGDVRVVNFLDYSRQMHLLRT